jgi:hypothetical protein
VGHAQGLVGGAQAMLAAPERAFAPLALGDVAQDEDHAALNRQPDHLDPFVVAARPRHHELGGR